MTEYEQITRDLIRTYRTLPEEYQNQLKTELWGEMPKSAIKVYKLMHKPTGLFFKPMGSGDGNLGLTGKVYSKRPGIPSAVRIQLGARTIKANTLADKIESFFKTRNGYVNTPLTDWEVIQY